MTSLGRILGAIAAAFVCAAGASGQTQQPVAWGSSCSALNGLGTARTKAMEMRRIPAGDPLPARTGLEARDSQPPVRGLSEFCRLILASTPGPGATAEIEAWLPYHTWNGNLLGVGAEGETAANRYRSMAAALTRGHATFSMGPVQHAGGRDVTPDILHEAVVALKNIMTAFYDSRPPRRSYWAGCSAEGPSTLGLRVASQYKDDFDGVFDAAPAGAAAWPGGSAESARQQLTAFVARGGRVLLHYGPADGTPRGAEAIAAFDQVARALPGGEGGAARLFVLPAAAACAADRGLDLGPMITALEDWVERGQPPDRIVAASIGEGRVLRQQLLCPHPLSAIYAGAGSRDDAANFVCRRP